MRLPSRIWNTYLSGTSSLVHIPWGTISCIPCIREWGLALLDMVVHSMDSTIQGLLQVSRIGISIVEMKSTNLVHTTVNLIKPSETQAWDTRNQSITQYRCGTSLYASIPLKRRNTGEARHLLPIIKANGVSFLQFDKSADTPLSVHNWLPANDRIFVNGSVDDRPPLQIRLHLEEKLPMRYNDMRSNKISFRTKCVEKISKSHFMTKINSSLIWSKVRYSFT